MSSASSMLGLVVGIVEIVLAALVLRRLGRFGRSYPWLVGMLVFFLLRGATRIYETFSARAAGEIQLALDGVVLLAVLFLFAGLDRTVAALGFAHAAAAARAREYQRALADYRTLARHRLANPLAAILGSATALEQLPELETETRRELLAILRRETERLEQVVLEPEPMRPEERGLRPRPELNRVAGPGLMTRSARVRADKDTPLDRGLGFTEPRQLLARDATACRSTGSSSRREER